MGIEIAFEIALLVVNTDYLAHHQDSLKHLLLVEVMICELSHSGFKLLKFLLKNGIHSQDLSFKIYLIIV